MITKCHQHLPRQSRCFGIEQSTMAWLCIRGKDNLPKIWIFVKAIIWCLSSKAINWSFIARIFSWSIFVKTFNWSLSTTTFNWSPFATEQVVPLCFNSFFPSYSSTRTFDDKYSLMSASQELGWGWEQWANWYSHQSCHARFCLEVVWSHSGAKWCQIIRWLQGSKSYHHVFCHLRASFWPSGYESPWQTCNSLCSHKKRNSSRKWRQPPAKPCV